MLLLEMMRELFKCSVVPVTEWNLSLIHFPEQRQLSLRPESKRLPTHRISGCVRYPQPPRQWGSDKAHRRTFGD